MDTMLRAMGLKRRTKVRTIGPLSLTSGATARLDRLAAGVGLVVHAEPEMGGWRVMVDEGVRPDGFVEIEPDAWMAPEHRGVLHGIRLDHDGHRWKVLLDLAVQAAETPNPDSRRYLVDRPLHQGRPAFFTRGTPTSEVLAARLFAHHAVRSVMFKDNTVSIEREGDAAWAPIDRHVDASLRDHFLMCGPLVDGNSLNKPTRDDPLEQAVALFMEQEVLPGVHSDGGNIELQRIEDGVVYVTMEGACASCPASTLTLKGAVETRLIKAFPGEIERVESIG